MAILLIHKDVELEEKLMAACNELGFEPVIFTATTERHAQNYLVDTEELEAVFIGPYLLSESQDTISSGLVREFTRVGFGFHKKPLVAVSLHRNNRLKQAGCSYETDGDGSEFRLILQQLKLDGCFHREMSHAG